MWRVRKGRREGRINRKEKRTKIEGRAGREIDDDEDDEIRQRNR